MVLSRDGLENCHPQYHEGNNGMLKNRWVKKVLEKLQNKTVQKYLLTGISVSVTIVVLGFLVWRERATIFSLDIQFQWLPILIACGCYVLATFITGNIWADIMSVLGSRSSRRQNIATFIVTNLGKRLPGTIWYVAWRAQIYRQDNFSLGLISLASAMELAVLIVAGVLISIVFSIPLVLNYPFGVYIIAFLTIISIVFIQPAFIRRLVKRLGGQFNPKSYPKVLVWILIFALVWLIGGTALYFVARTFTFVGIEKVPFFLGVWSFVGIMSFILMFLPTNLGFNEIGISLLLSQVLPSPIAVVTAISMRIMTTLLDIILTLITLRTQTAPPPLEEEKL